MLLACTRLTVAVAVSHRAKKHGQERLMRQQFPFVVVDGNRGLQGSKLGACLAFKVSYMKRLRCSAYGSCFLLSSRYDMQSSTAPRTCRKPPRTDWSGQFLVLYFGDCRSLVIDVGPREGRPTEVLRGRVLVKSRRACIRCITSLHTCARSLALECAFVYMYTCE